MYHVTHREKKDDDGKPVILISTSDLAKAYRVIEYYTNYYIQYDEVAVATFQANRIGATV